MENFSAETIEQIGWYVYLYRDPRDGEVFYVGKGCGNRVFSHLRDESESEKTQRIAAIRAAEREPILEVLRHNLPDEKTAYLVESAIIDLIGVPPLANRVRGHNSAEAGRISVEEISALYATKPVEISPKHKVILIRVNQLFDPLLDANELYEITRGVWKTGSRADETEFAFAVYKGVVREVYRIEKWHTAGTTPYQTRSPESIGGAGRREFTGNVAEDSVRKKYRLKSVKNYFGKNWQTPFVYVNC